MLTRRGVIGAAAGLAMPGLARGAETVRIGYIADYQNISLPAIAADQKMWQAEGLAPDIKLFTNGPIQIQAMQAGSLDFGAIGPGALWLPASGRTKVVAINLLTFSDRVVGQADIPSMAALKGRKVGVPQGTSGEMILRLALAKAGMAITDIEVVPMDPSTIVAAFSSQQIAGAGLWYPLVEVMKRRVPGLHELASDEEFYPATSFPNSFVARNDTMQSNPDLVRRFVRVLKAAMDWRVANFDRSVALSADFLGLPTETVMTVAKTVKLLSSAELVRLTQDGTVDHWLTTLTDLFRSFGTVAAPLAPSQYYEGKLFVSA